MTAEPQLTLHLRTVRLAQNADGHTIWQEQIETRQAPARRTAIIICDMWDNHWSRGAAERVDAMVSYMNQVIAAARGKGVQIIHAPSDTMAFYEGTPARERVQNAPPVTPPEPQEREVPPLPIDASDEGSDTGETETYRAWSRQHAAIEIDPKVDGVSDKGLEVYSFLQQQGIEQVLIMGVHTNMCVLNRSFAIKQMVKWGVNIALVRDLTDTMYNPARSPYVSHDEGTQLVIGYIERFWCPSILSEDIL
jgi:nicotinamidase-related amidase